MTDDVCSCFNEVVAEARSNALHHAYTILADTACLGLDDDKPPRSALFQSAVAIVKMVIDDHYSDAERKPLMAALAKLSTTALQLTVMEYADEQSKGH
jgi:hypothetical protein